MALLQGSMALLNIDGLLFNYFSPLCFVLLDVHRLLIFFFKSEEPREVVPLCVDGIGGWERY
jgi:hypothetical protein